MSTTALKKLIYQTLFTSNVSIVYFKKAHLGINVLPVCISAFLGFFSIFTLKVCFSYQSSIGYGAGNAKIGLLTYSPQPILSSSAPLLASL